MIVCTGLIAIFYSGFESFVPPLRNQPGVTISAFSTVPVQILGKGFSDSTKVRIAGQPCREQNVVSDQLINCLPPILKSGTTVSLVVCKFGILCRMLWGAYQVEDPSQSLVLHYEEMESGGMVEWRNLIYWSSLRSENCAFGKIGFTDRAAATFMA